MRDVFKATIDSKYKTSLLDSNHNRHHPFWAQTIQNYSVFVLLKWNHLLPIVLQNVLVLCYNELMNVHT